MGLGLGPGSMGSNILCRNVGIGPKQGQEFCPQVGGPATVHAGIPHPLPPRPGPPDQAPSWEQAPPRPGTLSPRGPGTPPPKVEHAGRYGQRAGGTHLTGMQSCFLLCQSRSPVLAPYSVNKKAFL